MNYEDQVTQIEQRRKNQEIAFIHLASMPLPVTPVFRNAYFERLLILAPDSHAVNCVLARMKNQGEQQ